MKRSVSWILCAAILLVCGCKGRNCEETDFTRWVNPFIGTLHEGHCFPGATVPFGMVQPGPESHTEYLEGYEMDHVTGYQYTDPLLKGFTQTHLNGVGCPSMSDILLMPFSRAIVEDPDSPVSYYSDYDKDSEQASPGYYAVDLKRNDVKVSLTASPHVAYHQYVYGGDEASLLVDLQYGVNWDVTALNTLIAESSETFDDDYTLSGYRLVDDWTRRKVFYVIRFDKKIIDRTLLKGDPKEKGRRYVLKFDMGADSLLQVKVALSTTGTDGAERNMQAEIPDWNCFETVRNKARDLWNGMLSKACITADPDKKTAFYTSMYHLFLQPNNIADVDGCYRAANDSICRSADGRFYSTFSLWDTFRAVHPMYTLMIPDSVGVFVNSLMEAYANHPVNPDNEAQMGRFLPRWPLWGRETNTMVANHAVPVVVEAYQKGLLSDAYTTEEYLQAILTSLNEPHYRNHKDLIDRYGYIPYDDKIRSYDDGRETVSRLLEGCYDDYSAGVMASGLGRDSLAEAMCERAGYYRNVYDSKSGFMCGRSASGVFKTENPTEVVGEWLPESSYTEGNSWHYLFHVLHDVPGMIELMGGKEAFADKLDAMFYAPDSPEVRTLVWKIIGTVGQYWHGNEPCHHVPYLYKFTDRGYKADALIGYLANEFYINAPDGLKGNDDCGQMSAWYMFASLGFYPIDPVSCRFVIGAPQIDGATMKWDNGKIFTVKVERPTDDCIFVKETYLNGTLLDRPYITYDEIMGGGTLRFVMYDRPDRDELLPAR